MKILLLASLLCLPPDGDRERGLRLYADGKYTEAAKAFEAAIAAEGESPELQYNLAMARWRAGELSGAEEAAEKMGAMSGDSFHARYQGLLGAVRHSESAVLEQQGDAARQASLEQAIAAVEQALEKSKAARDCFARAGQGDDKAASASRNLERELQHIAALQKKLEEMKQDLEKQKQEQKDKDKDKKDQDKKDEKRDDKDKKDDQDKKDQDKKDQEQKDQQQKDQQQKDQQKKDQEKSDQEKKDKDDKKGDQQKDPQSGDQGEPKPEPKPEPQPEPKDQKPQQGEQPKDEKQGEAKPEPQPAGQPKDQPDKDKRQDAPGEMQVGELSPEQRARVLEQLQQLDAQLQAYRARARSARKPVEKDW